MMPTASNLINKARSQIGVKENPIGSNRVKYNDWYVNTGFGSEAYRTAAWCAIFVSWCAQHSAVPDTAIPVHAYTPTGLAWFQRKNRVTRGSGAKIGDIVYINYPGQIDVVGHVGIVENVFYDGTVQTIEGNTNTSGSDVGIGVFRLRRPINNRLYFAHPDYQKEKVNTDVKLNDVIGKDNLDRPVTVGQALARGAHAYDAIFQKGWLGSSINVIRDDVKELGKRVSELES